ncbi:MAG: hypothetical protein IKC13_02650 [Elusimicrobiaceae bacterium]|nr:hypothetical protein [Elusimicrobiaceae bacterium]
MKKILVFSLMVLASSALFAEEMPFVTLLSQPVGSFSKVELTSGSPTRIYHLNFCNTNATGTKTIKIGTTAVNSDLLNVATLKMGDNTLKGNVKNYITTTQTQVSGTNGNLKMKVLKASTVDFPANYAKNLEIRATLTSNANHGITTQSASFNAMYIPSVGNYAGGGAKGGTFTWSGVNCTPLRKDDSGCNANILHD